MYHKNLSTQLCYQQLKNQIKFSNTLYAVVIFTDEIIKFAKFCQPLLRLVVVAAAAACLFVSKSSSRLAQKEPF